jgi:hypothetical protein
MVILSLLISVTDKLVMTIYIMADPDGVSASGMHAWFLLHK